MVILTSFFQSFHSESLLKRFLCVGHILYISDAAMNKAEENPHLMRQAHKQMKKETNIYTHTCAYINYIA